MRAELQISVRTAIEVVAVLGVYSLFLAIGMYGGQTTMNVDIITPPDGTQLRSSPVELVARVTQRGVPIPNVTARFALHYGETDQGEINTVTDSNGMARLLAPAPSGNYTWHVTAIWQGYPEIVSSSRSFSIRLMLVVEGLLPSTWILAVSPVAFRTRVTDMEGRLVQSANVTFYVDSTRVGSSLSGASGIAKLSSPLASGKHTWFASASKSGEGGISQPVNFIVGQLASFATGNFESRAPEVLQLVDDPQSSRRGPEPSYVGATARRSANALNE